MKIERTKNAGRNIVFGVILKVYQILIPFLMRTIMIYFMGIQYLGLSSLFTSILQVLNLAELGVGSAMVYSMYKPIAEDDNKTICALMGLYRTYYRIIGLVIALLGVCTLPFLDKLIKSDLPEDVNIYILFLLNLSLTVLSYWLFAYKNCLLNAYQRNDVVSKVALIMNTIQYALQIVVLIFLKNYYIYILVALITQALTNIVTAVVVTKMYPQYSPRGKLDSKTVKVINNRIKDLFTAKFGSVVVSSADTIVISAFLGLTSLAVYQNYYYILNSVYNIVGVIFIAVTAGIGNSLIVESIDKNYNDFKKFTFIISWIICICCCCFEGLYQPFMKIWMRSDELMLPDSFVFLFCLYFYLLEITMLWATIKDAIGLWHSDRFRPLIGAIVNLLLNVILVNFIGLYGILLSTILSYLFISMPWLIHNLFKYVYKRSLWAYLYELLKYFLVCIMSVIITWLICGQISDNGIFTFVMKFIISVLIPNILVIVTFKNSDEFTMSIRLLKKMINHK